MKSVSSALEARLQITQCRGTVSKLVKLSSETGMDQLLCLKCSALNPSVGSSEDGSEHFCLHAYAHGSAGKPVESLLRRIWAKLSR